MKLDAPTSADFDELLEFLPILYADGFEPILRWGGGNKTEDGAIVMSWPEYSSAVKDFFSAAARECWIDYDYVSKGVRDMIHDPDVVANASLEDLKSMLTWCVRGERFGDGRWCSVIENQCVRNVLLRLRALRPR